MNKIINDGTRSHAHFQRTLLFDDSDELVAANQKISQNIRMLNECINPRKNPKIQALIDEIINDASLVKPHDEMKML